MRFLSLFSGIEAASMAWLPLGWECVAVAEIEHFPCKMLAHHYPDVPNLGDVTKITVEQIAALGHIDLVVGGFPCQDLSVAGKRAGMQEGKTRSGLFYDAMRIVRYTGARWLLLENVPGLFSSRRGADFAALVGEVVGCEFGVPRNGWQNTGVAVGPAGFLEWCCLDAQYFGLAQRRARVFALADFGDWSSRPPILFEPESLSGHPAPRRETGEAVANALTERPDRGGGNSEGQRLIPQVAPTIPSRSTAGGGLGTDFDWRQQAFGGNNTAGSIACATALNACASASGRMDFESETFIVGALCADSHPGGYSGQDAYTGRLIAHTLRDDGFDASEDGTGRGTPLVPVAVRRLTCEEAEFLQGFPRGYTDIKPNGKRTPDGGRHKSLGNAMAVPVMQWIGQRIQTVTEIA